MVEFFEKIIGVLNEQQIPYMLSGSVAMSLYVMPRATADFDFIVYLKPQHVNSFVEQFQDGYYCDKDSVNEAVKFQSMFNIIDHKSGFKADFVVLKDSQFRQTEFNRRMQVNFFGKDIYVVSPEDLLISKLIWIQDLQSSLQIEDIKNLKTTENLDWNYINEWINKLKLNTFGLL